MIVLQCDSCDAEAPAPGVAEAREAGWTGITRMHDCDYPHMERGLTHWGTCPECLFQRSKAAIRDLVADQPPPVDPSAPAR